MLHAKCTTKVTVLAPWTAPDHTPTTLSLAQQQYIEIPTAFKVAEPQFCGRSAVTRVTVRVLKLEKQTWQRKSKGTQKTISQYLLIKIL